MSPWVGIGSEVARGAGNLEFGISGSSHPGSATRTPDLHCLICSNKSVKINEDAGSANRRFSANQIKQKCTEGKKKSCYRSPVEF